jgi:hypothetical protein
MITFETLFTPLIRSCLGCGLKVSLSDGESSLKSAVLDSYCVCYNCGSRFREPIRYPLILE